MNKIFKLFMLAVVVLGFSSCYNDLKSLLQPKSGQKKTSQIAN